MVGLPSGAAGSTARLNQSAGIASYVTLRRTTSTASVKVRIPEQEATRLKLRTPPGFCDLRDVA